ncbi:caspase family protein [Azohydromonas lata]|uniref:Caspase family protein n=1 Tax=Azohydromonas lata TaxID=45677 RepID=A0ABU5IPA5_9BURK|nr:caspase family protein [Azohydromonas lata]MDZ5460709.1 caspase family protein [Azohydromonas lata]
MAKKALCIGINDYPGTGMDLQGCVNDAQDWARELQQRGFGVTTLLDAQATKAAMAQAMGSLIEQGQGGDVLVITYSGHGTYVPDTDGDEVDGLDEALCPHDIRTEGALLDDEIHELFLRRQPKVKLVLVADSCHSGTVTRAAADPDADPRATRPRFMPIGNWMDAAALPRALPAVQGSSPLAKLMLRRSGDLLLAGCQEGPNHFSYDAHIAGRFNGAFTYYALKALRGLGADATYAQWHKAITPAMLPSVSYPQSPQLVGDAAARRSRIFA